MIRALERTLSRRIGSDYASYYHAIEGAQAFSTGRAGSISGLESPDERTLVVHLRRPLGELGAYFALSAAAPIPPGAAEGHKDYGRFLVASGPYMIEGSEQLDFSVPPTQQKPVSGYRPGRSLTLVRNPSWDESADALRPAYVDRMEIAITGDLGREAARRRGGKAGFRVRGWFSADLCTAVPTQLRAAKRLHRGLRRDVGNVDEPGRAALRRPERSQGPSISCSTRIGFAASSFSDRTAASG